MRGRGSLAIPRGSLFGGGGGSGGGVDDFYDLTNIPSILRVVPESTTYSGVILQWASINSNECSVLFNFHF
jgi:hypothetical protein